MQSPLAKTNLDSTDIDTTFGDKKPLFSAVWSDSDASYLNPSRPSKLHRAWERHPRSPFNQQSRFRKVWKRYSLKSQYSRSRGTSPHSSTSLSQQSPQKITKKLCLTDGCERSRGAVARLEKDKPIRFRKGKVQEVPTSLEDPPNLDPKQNNPHNLKETAENMEPCTSDSRREDTGTRETFVLSPREKPFLVNSPLGGFQLLDTRASDEPPKNIVNNVLPLKSDQCEEVAKAAIGSEFENKSSSSIQRLPMETEFSAGEVGVYYELSREDNKDQSQNSNKLQAPTNKERPRPEDVANINEVKTNQSEGPRRTPVDETDLWEQSARTEPRSRQPLVEMEIFVPEREHAPSDRNGSPSDEKSAAVLPIDAMTTSKAEEQVQTLNIEQTLGSTTSLATHLDSDTAVLHAYLNRKQANKAENLQTNSIARRTSLEHRRDSGAVRQALASPRNVLEDKDVNSPAPGKPNNADFAAIKALTPVKDASESAHPDDLLQTNREEATPARRSTRKRSRIPPPSAGISAVAPTNIAVRSGADSVVLKRTDAQEMAILTRVNTRKNKGGALLPRPRLAKLVAAGAAEELQVEISENNQDGQRSIEWADPLVQGMMSPARETSEEPASTQQEDDGVQTPKPRVKRLRGSRNGTPAKGMLTTAQLPSEIEQSADNSLMGIGDAKAKKPLSPKKLKFVAGNDGQENRSAAPKKKSGIPVGAPTTATRASGRKRAAAT